MAGSPLKLHDPECPAAKRPSPPPREGERESEREREREGVREGGREGELAERLCCVYGQMLTTKDRSSGATDAPKNHLKKKIVRWIFIFLKRGGRNKTNVIVVVFFLIYILLLLFSNVFRFSALVTQH